MAIEPSKEARAAAVAAADVQERLQLCVSGRDIEVHEDEFVYWPRRERKSRKP